MTFFKFTPLALSLALSASAALAAGHMVGGVKEMNTPAGTVLANADGMTLYTFDNDTTGQSNCNGGCATNWPPLMAEDGAHDHEAFTVITRDDGTHQWAYNGEALYLWVGDTNPGDISGDGVNGVWHIAQP
ncbi:COG4315 family predicted lipoprotein [Cochlodiniinecator piscidefendens]|uniref:COG4315 family predicted lipoprotein n=1 Tax=Cochlodiniinecator piscidefendens TaxID=2715756 RepID=UPI001408AC21|nr:hypothetical protein [Cochlodiniinecator piscidefendens]